MLSTFNQQKNKKIIPFILLFQILLNIIYIIKNGYKQTPMINVRPYANIKEQTKALDDVKPTFPKPTGTRKSLITENVWR